MTAPCFCSEFQVFLDTLILSEMELVLDLLGSRVLSRWRLESSKLEPTPESEQEMHRDLRLQLEQIFIKFQKHCQKNKSVEVFNSP